MSKAIQPEKTNGSIDTDGSHVVPEAAVFEELSDYTKTFLEAVAREAGVDDYQTKPAIVDAVAAGSGVQLLVAFPEGECIFIGRDETSKDSGLFGIIIGEGGQSVRTVEEALALLKPAPVLAAEQDARKEVLRQGEWWFVETDNAPEYIVSGELDSKPYGPSPLENHVAREYGFGLTQDRLLEELSLYASDGECDQVFDRAPRCFDSIRNQDLVWGRRWSGRFQDFEWDRIWDVCNGIYVRGTVRHRDREHYMLSLGESWHAAYTHDVTVYQPMPTTYGSGGILISNSTYVD